MKYFAIAAVVIAACSTSTATEQITDNVITLSRMDPSHITANRDAIVALATRKLVAEALASTDGQIFSVLVACALPANMTVTSAATGIEYLGEIGLAPEWARYALGKDAREWVSACVMAKCSGRAVALPISMRGSKAALSANQDERDFYTQEEGAFYGNIFAKPQELVACNGRDGANIRVCALEDENRPGFTRCGFTFDGNCQDACDSFTYGAYRNCSHHRNVVTVFGAP